jgi:hypothetical protein
VDYGHHVASRPYQTPEGELRNRPRRLVEGRVRAANPRPTAWFLYTSFSTRQAGHLQSLLYSDWQQADGLLLPRKMEGHKFENDKLGDLRYQAEFSNVHLTRAQPAASLFTMPQGAEMDSVKQ